MSRDKWLNCGARPRWLAAQLSAENAILLDCFAKLHGFLPSAERRRKRLGYNPICVTQSKVVVRTGQQLIVLRRGQCCTDNDLTAPGCAATEWRTAVKTEELNTERLKQKSELCHGKMSASHMRL